MRYILALLLHVQVLACGLWDVFVLSSEHPEETVSNVIHEWAARFPVLPLALGLVIGHIFWPHTAPNITVTNQGQFKKGEPDEPQKKKVTDDPVKVGILATSPVAEGEQACQAADPARILGEDGDGEIKAGPSVTAP